MTAVTFPNKWRGVRRADFIGAHHVLPGVLYALVVQASSLTRHYCAQYLNRTLEHV